MSKSHKTFFFLITISQTKLSKTPFKLVKKGIDDLVLVADNLASINTFQPENLNLFVHFAI